MGHALLGVANQRGWDCNAVVSSDDAQAFAAAGYSFCLRYIRRANAAANDLSVAEIQTLHAQGLAVMPIQHFGPAEGWVPTAELGEAYGTTAALACSELEIPAGVSCWLDLEGVAEGTSSDQIIRFCDEWWGAVGASGYDPGIYVGDANRLTPNQLYGLRFDRYYAAYNLNADQYPATCGVCIRQHEATGADKPAGVPFSIDTDEIIGDKLGRFPTLFAP